VGERGRALQGVADRSKHDRAGLARRPPVLCVAPYDAAVRLTACFLATEADCTGRCILQGVSLYALSLTEALDVIYTLALDDRSHDASRREAAERFDFWLATPLDPKQAEEYQEMTWGSQPGQHGFDEALATAIGDPMEGVT
jgi:hypothetical protein